MIINIWKTFKGIFWPQDWFAWMQFWRTCLVEKWKHQVNAQSLVLASGDVSENLEIAVETASVRNVASKLCWLPYLLLKSQIEFQITFPTTALHTYIRSVCKYKYTENQVRPLRFEDKIEFLKLAKMRILWFWLLSKNIEGVVINTDKVKANTTRPLLPVFCISNHIRHPGTRGF